MDIIGILFFRIKIKKWSRRIFALVLCVAIIVNGQFVEVLAAETDDVRLESTQEEDIGEEQDLLLHDVDEISTMPFLKNILS